MRNAASLYGCDALVLDRHLTTTGMTILAKNSDRPVDDCQPLVYHPRTEREETSALGLEYVEIPQAKVTYATLGSGPYWCYGYEVGVNEHGVAAGNVAVYTKEAKEAARAFPSKGVRLGLLGMDLVRLGLERGESALEALRVMTALLEEYGQFGSGLPQVSHQDGSYDNSYIVADGREAYVLETAGREWAAKKVSRLAAISNEPTIRSEYDLSSAGLRKSALRRGWWQEGKGGRRGFDFARSYIDFERPLQFSHLRYRRAIQLLERRSKVSPRYLARVMRDHYEDSFIEGPCFNAALPDFLTLCMHSSPAGFTWGNTAASAIILLPDSKDRLPIMLWSPLTPCTGCYLPFFVDGGAPPPVVSRAGTAGRFVKGATDCPRDRYSPDSYWWAFRELLETVKFDELGSAFEERQPKVRRAFDTMETDSMRRARGVERRAAGLIRAGRSAEARDILKEFETRSVESVLKEVRRLNGSFTAVDRSA